MNSPLHRLLSLMFLSLTANVTANPNSAALEYLQKIQRGTMDLAPNADTAIHANLSNIKRKFILNKLETLQAALKNDLLEVTETRIEHPLAAVIIKQTDPHHLAPPTFHAVAVISNEQQWRPAPVLGSFENTEVILSPTLSQQAAQLVDWMNSKCTEINEQQRNLALANTDNAIRQAFNPEELRSLSPKQIYELFLKSCAEQSIPRVLALLGGMSPTRPADWEDRHAFALKLTAPNSPWEILSQNEHKVFRILIDEENDPKSSLFSIAYLTPQDAKKAPGTPPRFSILYIEIRQHASGTWEINLPESFILNGTPSEVDDVLDADLYARLAQMLDAQYPNAAPLSFEKSVQSLNESWQQQRIDHHLSLLQRPTPSLSTWSLTITDWLNHQNEPGTLWLYLDSKKFAQSGVAAFHLYSPKKPLDFQLRLFTFQKNKLSWLWNPNPLPNTFTPAESATLESWQNSQKPLWSSSWQKQLTRSSTEILSVPPLSQNHEQEGKDLITAFLKAINQGRTLDALALTCHLGTPSSRSLLLANLSSELLTPTARPTPAPTITLSQGQHTLLASITTASPSPKRSMYPIIQTPQGLRILLEIKPSQPDSANFPQWKKLHPKAAADLDGLSHPPAP